MKVGVYEAVMDRDRRCVLSFLEPGHECRTRYGTPHPADAREFLTYEHVKQHLAMGIRKVDDARWGVALCGAANARPPTKAQRNAIREYLASFTNNDCGHIDPRWDCDTCQSRKVTA